MLGKNAQELIATLVLLTHGGEGLSRTCSFQTVGLKWDWQVINECVNCVAIGQQKRLSALSDAWGENAKCLLIKCVAAALAILRGRISGILINHYKGHI